MLIPLSCYVVSTLLVSAFTSGSAPSEFLDWTQAERGPELHGIVVDASSEVPIPGARITFSPIARGLRQQTFRADANGRISLPSISPGRYAVRIEAQGFLPGAFGQRWPNGPSRPLVIHDTLAPVSLRVHLSQAAAIEGVVQDKATDAIAGATVRLISFGPDGTKIDALPPVTTDDRGRYRFYGVSPGRYTVGIIQQYTTVKTGTAEERVLQVAPHGLGADRAPTDDHIFLSGFYGGSSQLQDANQLVIGSGDSVTGADLVVRTSRFGSVAGVVMMEGQPATKAMLTLIPSGVGRGSDFGPLPVASTESDGAGKFVLDGVPAGSYSIRAVLRARKGTDAAPVLRRTESGAEVLSGRVAGFYPPGSEPLSWVEIPVEVRSSLAASQVTVELERASEFLGRIVSSDNGKPSVGSGSIGRFVLRLDPLELQQATIRADVDSSTMGFRVPSMPPAQYYVVLASSIGPHRVLDARTSLPLHPIIDARTPRAPLEIKVAAPGRIRGTVQLSEGERDALVAVFPADRQLWLVPRRPSDIFQLIDLAVGGAFETSALPPGRYLAVAISGSFLNFDWRDAEVLGQLASFAQSINLAASATEVVTLKPVRLPRQRLIE